MKLLYVSLIKRNDTVSSLFQPFDTPIDTKGKVMGVNEKL
jgi:hypothetical protein